MIRRYLPLLVRHPSFALLWLRFQKSSVLKQVDAVISTIGGTPADASADSEGNINLIKAAVKKGVKRFVLVTSIGTGDSKDAPPKQVGRAL